METASNLIGKVMGTGNEQYTHDRPSDRDSDKNKKVEDAETHTKDTAPSVEHETVRRKHEHREQEVIDRERHQDHYKTTVQPLKDRDVGDTEHKYEEAGVEHRHISHDKGDDAKAILARKKAQFEDTSKDARTEHKHTKEAAEEHEHVHHHLHETIQPVIEKETVLPSVTHKKIPIKETHQEAPMDHGVEVKKPISIDEFQGRLGG
ncbi:hypothetical protein F5Y18DRAFT_129372 [Xylariaceae sp. FL1019]|nr:hypothetical protein F5Y18DRAFT_129372 [Xylariaceae sp. FL1019]